MYPNWGDYNPAMPWQEYVGYVGSFLMFSSFWMRTMINLRLAGMTGNVAMIIYSAAAGLYPILALQIVMFPVNILRLWQMRRLVLRVAQTAAGGFRPDALIPFMKKEKHRDGDVLFKAGDASDKMYWIRSGRVKLKELGASLESGDLFGEIGIVSPHNARTATAVCEGDTLLMSISRSQVRQIYLQEPEFGFFLMQLVTERLLHNLEAARS